MSDRPNVLLISTDHWPASLIGAAGHPAIQTPTLDDLCRSGVRFSNTYGECPVCIPARRTLMTGTSPRTHGDRVFNEKLPMPELKTMAQAFRDGGYQAYAVGKLHVYPQRDRIGFDDVMLDEEGRAIYGVLDDYDQFLGDQGYPGRQFDHGMSNNQYSTRPWHLPEETHATNWATQQMVRTIKRRDPNKPAFWFLSYRHPHPPLVPLKTYLDMYDDVELDEPVSGEWASDPAALPYSLQANVARGATPSPDLVKAARKAFYALCTHIDHQIRVIIGSLREEGLLDNTIICFTSDHGDMLGNQGMWAKRLFYDMSANIPMIIVGAKGGPVGFNQTDDRLVGWQDVMPTLLDLCDLEIPDSVEGLPMFRDNKRAHLYGEVSEDDGHATRMIHDGRHKLIYYAVGNHRQLFDMAEDPRELNDLAGSPEHAETLERLTKVLISEFYGGDLKWVEDGRLVGQLNRDFVPGPNKSLTSQRGHHWPPPPKTDMPQIEWHSDAAASGKGSA